MKWRGTALGVLLACACAGKSPEPARPAGGAPPPVAAAPPASATPQVGSAPPVAPTAPSDEPSSKPVGTKLVQDAKDSPKDFTLGVNDNSGHALGKMSMTVDGRNVWPPAGPGCPELVRCCTALAGLDESLALACLLAAGRDPDCPTALRTSEAIAGESGVALPAACPR
jgi:hypothetical protein